jgi:protein-L-isoaspartate(D-aspartate) O-methyltransferase
MFNLFRKPEDPLLPARRRMVEEQIRGRGIRDENVLSAMMEVPREEFLPSELRELAYDDRAIGVGFQQTISQPFIVAYMTEQLDVLPHCRILEVGTGTGYQTAILAKLGQHVYSVERIPELRDRAAETLARLGVKNVTLIVGDGTLGLPEEAPFDRIIVTAGAPSVPPPLVEQLADGGLMVLPVGGETEQSIVRVARFGDRVVDHSLLGCRFVKLIGDAGWRIATEGSEE